MECDVRLSRDGHLVCVHDRRVDRTSDGTGVVSTLTLDELSALDYGEWHDELPESADGLLSERVARPSSGRAGRGVLTLPALLDELLAWPGTRLFVETKHPVRYSGAVERALVGLLREYGLADPASAETSTVVAMSFSSVALWRLRRQAPKLPTVLLTDDLPRSRRDGSLPRSASATGPDVGLLRADPGYVARAAARGHAAYCWTVDDPADIALCSRLDVDYLATNSPGRAVSLLGQ